MGRLCEILIGVFISLLFVWLLFASAAFYEFANLECVKYTEWEEAHSKMQTRECILYKRTKEQHDKE